MAGTLLLTMNSMRIITEEYKKYQDKLCATIPIISTEMVNYLCTIANVYVSLPGILGACYHVRVLSFTKTNEFYWSSVVILIFRKSSCT